MEANLSKSSLKERLGAYYELVAPHLLENEATWASRFEEIYEKFGGSIPSEKKLQAKLAKKYGNDVKLPITTSAYLLPPKAKKHKLSPVPKPTLTPEEEKALLQSSTKNIDFTSASFDAYTALHSEETAPDLFLSSTEILDNIDKFPTQNKNKNKEDQPLIALAQSLKDAPLGLLSRCMASRSKVTVMVRYANCIRGTVVGFVDGFDKHYNMILSHAVEFYYPRSVDDNVSTQVEVERRRRNSRYKSRKFKQLIIRGDNVVTVQIYRNKNR
ncbi:hypothetical protein TL16_g00905 [Triparma laevis f. inornata]|uniref:Sm domain-containing protein n=1 Tax=Triparma laevis f. inornata TaxID=1714386 RepID=A0A9W7DQT9_9STRA|nr:hypothetical protein TL16_g00905 [Triparma laevis f. inornata]